MSGESASTAGWPLRAVDGKLRAAGTCRTATARTGAAATGEARWIGTVACIEARWRQGSGEATRRDVDHASLAASACPARHDTASARISISIYRATPACPPLLRFPPRSRTMSPLETTPLLAQSLPPNSEHAVDAAATQDPQEPNAGRKMLLQELGTLTRFTLPVFGYVCTSMLCSSEALVCWRTGSS